MPRPQCVNVTSHTRSATDGVSLLEDIFWVINDRGQRPTDSRIVTLSVFLFINYQCEMYKKKITYKVTFALRVHERYVHA